jgi:hypothetical protein
VTELEDNFCVGVGVGVPALITCLSKASSAYDGWVGVEPYIIKTTVLVLSLTV